MKKTFATTMPDEVGAFLAADRVITNLGLNITRVSYNKAVDTHMLFLEVEGDEFVLDLAQRQLEELGYLQGDSNSGSVFLMEFQLPDRAGALLPVLELIHEYAFNISYISSQENGTPHQYFKMGLFVEDEQKLSRFMREAAMICPIRVIDYDRREKVLDNTVFYLNFANEISSKMGLDADSKNALIIASNQVMQMLDERDGAPAKTFDYIARFADLIRHCKGEHFNARVSCLKVGETPITLIEPPCGSNITIFDLGDSYLICDSGFACYRKETLALLQELFPDFFQKPRTMFITHADADHCGYFDMADKVYMNADCLENFRCENEGRSAIREENPIHAPYVHISKILSDYDVPKLDNLCLIQPASGDAPAPFTRIGTLQVAPFCFEVYQGSGGHVKGEMIYVERTHHMVFTGDIFVNIKGFTVEQAAFNRLAPYLMTSVDTDPDTAKLQRQALPALLGKGMWKVFPGHGSVMELVVE